MDENYQDLTDEELAQAYANQSSVDWYKCNLIRAEQQRRADTGRPPRNTPITSIDASHCKIKS